jgi:hypothetical protein
MNEESLIGKVLKIRFFDSLIGNPQFSFPSFPISLLTFQALHFTQLPIYSKMYFFDSRQKEKYKMVYNGSRRGYTCLSATANQGFTAAYQ